MPSPLDVARLTWRMSAVRLTLAMSLFFVVATAVGAAAVVLVVRVSLLSSIDDTIAARLDAVVAGEDSDEPEDLIERVAELVGTSDSERLIALTTAGGQTVVGNTIAHFRDASRWTYTIGDDTRVRAGQIPAGGYRLVVTEPLEQVDDTIELLTSVLAWGGLATAGIMLAGGVLVGTRTQRRISTIQSALNQVAAGQLEARLPEAGHVDDIDRIAASTNLTVARLQASVASLRDLSANIAHDLKTPVTRLVARLDAMQDDLAETGGSESVQAAAEEAREIAAMFDAILRISQIESGSRRERFAPVDLSGVLRRAAELHQDVATETGRRFTVSADSGPVMINGDEMLLVPDGLEPDCKRRDPHSPGQSRCRHRCLRTNAGGV